MNGEGALVIVSTVLGVAGCAALLIAFKLITDKKKKK